MLQYIAIFYIITVAYSKEEMIMSCYFNEGKESVSKYARCGVEKKTASF